MPSAELRIRVQRLILSHAGLYLIAVTVVINYVRGEIAGYRVAAVDMYGKLNIVASVYGYRALHLNRCVIYLAVPFLNIQRSLAAVIYIPVGGNAAYTA